MPCQWASCRITVTGVFHNSLVDASNIQDLADCLHASYPNKSATPFLEHYQKYSRGDWMLDWDSDIGYRTRRPVRSPSSRFPRGQSSGSIFAIPRSSIVVDKKAVITFKIGKRFKLRNASSQLTNFIQTLLIVLVIVTDTVTSNSGKVLEIQFCNVKLILKGIPHDNASQKGVIDTNLATGAIPTSNVNSVPEITGVCKTMSKEQGTSSFPKERLTSQYLGY
ncbi:hypothetical protein SISNIDRAFT_465629 [Sistotremastrum niveocremeum HHB9708]|uniref:Uncharacterized protein n=1 Tax=Sistotremastrum niveocremeum HHB9708 TaxID=1314777 RepID=A0A164VE92_9AGAM|nr:hypothetical protein SISNIDRAFT_465629 [Sistotremastrum niveocremeum HHB9708]